MLPGLDLGRLTVDDLQRGIHQDFQIAAGDENVDEGLETVPLIARADPDIETEAGSGRITNRCSWKGFS